jgi:hypothetical protein
VIGPRTRSTHIAFAYGDVVECAAAPRQLFARARSSLTRLDPRA